MNQSPSQDVGLGQLMILANRVASSPVDPVIDQIGRTRLIERATRKGFLVQFGRERFGLIPKVAWAMAAVFIVAGFVWGLASRPVSYVVRGSTTSEAYVRAADDQPVDVDFSDGTQIHGSFGSRLRIEERSRRGARILLERGHAMIHVAHRAGAEWRFVAGPFEVEVTGTRFSLDWDPAAEQLGLNLEEGTVDVVGPLGPGRVSMRAGQELRASLLARSLTLFEHGQAPPLPAQATDASSVPTEQSREMADPAPGAAAPAPAVHSRVKRTSSVESAPAEGAPAEGALASAAVATVQIASPQLSWSKLLAKGQFEAIVRLAESRERLDCAETCSATDLRVLAEAARYVGRTDLAERSLLALRRRFPEHPESRKAAFLLARLYEAQADRGRAEDWYRRYVEESPASELAADALAGQMRVVRRARGAKAAEPLAREYLRRYPDGVHAPLAQQILQD